MLPKRSRIHRHAEIVPVLRYGRSVPLSRCTARVRPNNLDHPRATVIVSTAVSKKAVVRNTIKRRIREALRREILPAITSFDVIIIAKSAAVNGSYQDFLQELKTLLKKAPYLTRPYRP